MALLNLDTPAAMDVITDKDIMNSGAKNAFDAVNMVPGITSFPMVHLALNMVLWIVGSIFVD